MRRNELADPAEHDAIPGVQALIDATLRLAIARRIPTATVDQVFRGCALAIRNFDELIGYLVSNTDVGQEVTVSILRDGETLDVPVVLDARPES